MSRLTALGVTTVPVVARGRDYVLGQDLKAIADFVGIEHEAARLLAPDVLVSRLKMVLAAAERFMMQIPAEHLMDTLPHRDRTYLMLCNHIFEIASGLSAVLHGQPYVGRLAQSLPEVTQGRSALVDYHQAILAGISADRHDIDWEKTIETFYGQQSLHAVLERITWHCAQHTRQLMMVLELHDIEPSGPLSDDDLSGLPMPAEVWDG